MKAHASNLCRYWHAYVHVGTNYVPMRLRLFLFGALVLVAMLALVAWKLAAGTI